MFPPEEAKVAPSLGKLAESERGGATGVEDRAKQMTRKDSWTGSHDRTCDYPVGSRRIVQWPGVVLRRVL